MEKLLEVIRKIESVESKDIVVNDGLIFAQLSGLKNRAKRLTELSEKSQFESSDSVEKIEQALNSLITKIKTG